MFRQRPPRSAPKGTFSRDISSGVPMLVGTNLLRLSRAKFRNFRMPPGMSSRPPHQRELILSPKLQCEG